MSDQSSVVGSMATPPRKRRSTKSIVLLVVIAAAVVFLAVSCGRLLTAPPSDDTKRAEVISACRGEVRAKLKDPSSADFSNEVATKLNEDNGWKVVGVVRATNSFGGVVPANFTCAGIWSKNDPLMSVSQLDQAE